MEEPEKLYILWTNADPVTSEKMVLMYAINSLVSHWWQEVTVILWGATARLAAGNPTIREKIRIARQAGVRFSACRACAEQLGVSDMLVRDGIEVIYWGESLTRLLKEHETLLTV